MQKGVLGQWNDAKGYGFIHPDSGGQRVYVHISAFAKSRRRPSRGVRVRFRRSSDSRGRPSADMARLPHASAMSTGTFLAVILAVVFFASMGALSASGALPAAVLLAYGTASGVLFIIYGIDKSRAQRQERRVPESYLQLIAVLCGWPGGLLAQQIFRHKTRKYSFLLAFWLAAIVNVLVLAGFSTSLAQGFINLISNT